MQLASDKKPAEFGFQKSLHSHCVGISYSNKHRGVGVGIREGKGVCFVFFCFLNG